MKTIDRISERAATLHVAVSNKAEHIKQLVDRRTEEMKDIVEKHAKSLSMEIEKIKSTKQTKLDLKKKEVDMQINLLGDYERYLTKITANGSDVDICRNFYEMKTKSEELESSHIRLFQSDSDPMHIQSFHFVPSNSSFENENLVEGVENIIGEITFGRIS